MSGITYEVYPHDHIYDNWSAGVFATFDFTALCEASGAEAMNQLTPQAIENHVYGMTMIRNFVSGHGSLHNDPVSYAGVTGFEDFGGNKLAVIGGIITLPDERGKGHSSATISALCEVASGSEAVDQHGHRGLLAKCNQHSHGLTEKLGFSEQDTHLGKTIMVKML